MNDFIKKLRNFGYRRAVVFGIIKFIIYLRKVFYKYIISDNSPKLIKTTILNPTQFAGKGLIKLNGVRLGVWPSPYLFSGSGYLESRSRESRITIDEGTVINNNFTIIADRESIAIGKRCLIGPNFFATDSNFHGLEISNRRNGDYKCKSICIEDDVFIGEGVRILKGVTIGRGSVIGCGSIVIKDIEPFTIYSFGLAKNDLGN